MTKLISRTTELLTSLGASLPDEGEHDLRTPITGERLGGVSLHTSTDLDRALQDAQRAFGVWRDTPAPVRGRLVHELGRLLREHKAALGELVSIEAGKILSEGLGEVQEMIDICDLAVGQSRQLFGLTIASERAGHRMMEQWHPLGVVGVISAFNFPVAVWSWNAALALVCGDPVVWKPSENAMITALAVHTLLRRAQRTVGAPEGLSALLLGGRELGAALADDPRVALVSATGSTRMGKELAPRVAARLGRYLLELGGNNAAIVTAGADLDLAVRAIVFSAAGTAGQRCTTLRRVIAHRDIVDELTDRLVVAYRSLPIGSPLERRTLVGPLINRRAYDGYLHAIGRAQAEGGVLAVGGQRAVDHEHPEAYYVEPTVIRMPKQTEIVRQETFAPILYIMAYDDLADAIEMHNSVVHGLSSSIFTVDLREAEVFLSAAGSDCGIANVNLGPSGAEIGGAFGGEKDTGGGRESGSDAWRSYMRRSTNTVNYSTRLPLAQGVEFG